MTASRRMPILATLATLFLLAGTAAAQAPKAPQGPLRTPDQPRRKAVRPAHRHDAAYKGRPIADVMSYLGADWLLRDTRIDEEQPDRMLDALEIAPGMSVADVGAGVGFHSVKLAERVGPEGIVYASDVQPQMLRMLIDRAQKAGVSNVIPVMCSQDYTGLPPGRIDLILMVDVYHEMSDPEAALVGLRQALKPGGRLVLVEFRGEDPMVPIKPEHKMTVEQVRKEVEPAGFRFAALHDFLPWQHILIFERPAETGAGGGVDPAATEVPAERRR